MMQDLFADQRDSNVLYAGRYPMRLHSSGMGHDIQIPEGCLHHAPGFLSPEVSRRLFQILLANDRYPVRQTHWQEVDLADIRWHTIPWRQDSIRMYGRQTTLPRLSSWHGDENAAYTYSGLALVPNPWNEPLVWLRERLFRLTGVRFNSVLLNWYRSGDDHISWHSDAEPELGLNPTIASVSMGATRRFLLRRREVPQEKVELPLSEGSLLVMSGALQHHWQHSIPREKRVQEGRISLTFRVVQPGSD